MSVPVPSAATSLCRWHQKRMAPAGKSGLESRYQVEMDPGGAGSEPFSSSTHKTAWDACLGAMVGLISCRSVAGGDTGVTSSPVSPCTSCFGLSSGFPGPVSPPEQNPALLLAPQLDFFSSVALLHSPSSHVSAADALDRADSSSLGWINSTKYFHSSPPEGCFPHQSFRGDFGMVMEWKTPP